MNTTTGAQRTNKRQDAIWERCLKAKAERAAQLAAFADKVYAASEPRDRSRGGGATRPKGKTLKQLIADYDAMLEPIATVFGPYRPKAAWIESSDQCTLYGEPDEPEGDSNAPQTYGEYETEAERNQ